MPDEPEPPDGDGAAERLAKYRAKRSADRTPEPFGGEEASRLAGGGGRSPGGASRRPRLGPPPPLLRPEARGDAPALRLPRRDRRGPALVGGAARPLARPQRQAHGGRGGGPPGRVRRLRGEDPRGQLRGGRGHRLGQGAVGPAREPRGDAAEGQAHLRAARLQAARRLAPVPDQGNGQGQGDLEGVDARQAARRVGERDASAAPGVDLLRADPRGDPHGEPAVGPGAGGAGAARGSRGTRCVRRR